MDAAKPKSGGVAIPPKSGGLSADEKQETKEGTAADVAKPKPSGDAAAAPPAPKSNGISAAEKQQTRDALLSGIGRNAALFASSGANANQPSFASSIKALNLEPMRGNTVVRPKAATQARPADLPPSKGDAAQPSSEKPAPAVAPAPAAQHAPPAPAASQALVVQEAQQQAQPMTQMSFPQMHQPGQLPMQNAVVPVPQQPQLQQQQQQLQQQQMMQQQAMLQQMPVQPVMQNVMPVQQPAQQMPTPVQPAPLAAGVAPKKKGIMLKNVGLKKDGGIVPRKPDEEKPKAQFSENPPKEDVVPAAPQEIAAVATPSRMNLRPTNGVFDRSLLLRIWKCSKKDQQHSTVVSLVAGHRPGDKGGASTRSNDKGRSHGGNERAFIIGTDSKLGNKKPKEHALKPSENAYRTGGHASGTHEEEIERKVRSLLNKICPDNLKTIVERLAQIELSKSDELEFVIRIIFGKALNEPHYCETYADMVFALRSRYPEFPAELEGEKPLTFTRVLLNTCQNEFEQLPTTFEATEEEKNQYAAGALNVILKKRKDKMLANMKFIGNLFLRQLLAVKVIGQVVHDLVGIREAGVLPEEHMIECVCELLQSIGHTLENTTHGKMLMSQFSARLQDLKTTKDEQTGAQHYPKRIQFQIQDLVDLKNNDWRKKLLKDQAKTVNEVRKDAVKESRMKAGEVLFETVTAGVRPAYIDELKVLKSTRQKSEGSQKQTWDQAYVKRLFQYFCEEKNGENLKKAWLELQPTSAQSKQGVEWLSELGFTDKAKEDVVAQTLVELLQRHAITWNILGDALGPSLEMIEDMKIDVPHCDLFLHSLISRLITMSGKDFNPIILRQLPVRGDGSASDAISWSILCGALRKIKKSGGLDAYRKAMDLREMADILCKAKGCRRDDLKKHLDDELR
jgi:hypothetical protein